MLYFEAMGKHSNLTLTEDGRILDALRHVSPDMTGAPAPAGGCPMRCRRCRISWIRAGWMQAELAAKDKCVEGPLEGFVGPPSPAFPARPRGNWPSGRQGTLKPGWTALVSTALLNQLTALFAALPRIAAPRLLLDLDGAPADAAPFPFIGQPEEAQEPRDTLSQAVETRFDARDRAQRLRRRAASLNKTVTNALNKARRKLAIIQEETPSFEQAERLG